jgi:D-glycero-alpha-D-manno-heptose-7-phosphate kinase
MIVSRTPYRLSFFGGGTDYPAWYRRHGGAVLATTIDKYCYITCRYLPPFFEHHSRVVYSKIEAVQHNHEIQHPAVRACLQYLREERGIEIHHDGDLPARSGIGSSSSFTVGLLNALHALGGRMISRQQLTKEAIHVEQEVIREVVGAQDQTSAAYGGLNHIEFLPDDQVNVTPVVLSAKRRTEFNNHLLLFFTGISRIAAEVAVSYVNNLAAHERSLHRMRAMVDEGMEILIGGGDLGAFGELLHEAWMLKRSLSDAVSTSTIDDLYARARKAGALGGKIAGAGGGGFMMVIARPEDHERICFELRDCLHVPVEMDPNGSQIIYYDDEIDYSAIAPARGNHAP